MNQSQHAVIEMMSSISLATRLNKSLASKTWNVDKKFVWKKKLKTFRRLAQVLDVGSEHQKPIANWNAGTGRATGTPNFWQIVTPIRKGEE